MYDIRYKMAATSIVLQSCLCFRVKRYGKIAVKPLQSMLLDFYGVDELYAAKQQLMSDITGMNLDIDLLHIPERDGRPAEYRWHFLLNAAKFVSFWLTPTTRAPCSNAAKTRNRLKFAGVPQTGKLISAVSGPKFAILRGHVEEILLFNKFFNCRCVH